MTVNLGGGLTMSFIAYYSGKRTVVASGVPTWDNRAAHPGEAGHHAIFGVEGYSNFPTGSKPALYQNDGYQNDSKIQLSDITITKNGQNVANLQYSFVMADAESTNKTSKWCTPPVPRLSNWDLIQQAIAITVSVIHNLRIKIKP